MPRDAMRHPARRAATRTPALAAALVATLVAWPLHAAAASGQGPVLDRLEAACAGIDNAGECARAIEASHAGQATAARFRREGAVLQVVTARQVFRFRDGDNSDGDVQHSYLAHLAPPGLHVLRRQYGEGNAFTVIGDADHAPHTVPGFPVLSPSATRFVSHSQAGESGYNPDLLEIWQVQQGRLRLEARLEPAFSTCTITQVHWLSETAVRLTGEPNPGQAGGPGCTVQVRRAQGRWRAD